MKKGRRNFSSNRNSKNKINKKILWILITVIIFGIVVVSYRYGSENVSASPGVQGTIASYEWWANKDRFKIYSIVNNIPGKYYDPDYGVIKPFTCTWLSDTYKFCTTPHDVTNVELTYNGKTECMELGKIPIIGTLKSDGGCKGLIAYYPLDGNALDYSGYANNGIVYGAVPTTGKIGQGYQFDGIDDFINIGNPPQLQLIDQFTVSAWVKFDLLNQYMGIVGKNKYVGGTKNSMTGWMMYRGTDGGDPETFMKYQFRFTVSDGRTPWKPFFTYSDVNHKDTEWHYVAIVKEGVNGYLYVDGELAGYREYEKPEIIVDSGEYASIGKQYSYHSNNGYGYAKGKIDEVKIWNYVLSDEEIMQEYKKGL